ncbi:putative RNA helicase [Rosa chinensis]|uniref:Putative RNA helicase n=1 Tax=Rosa chinensis TaxID=74649 RepID=A0A2P6R588_ROSCH|nr:putative RNA helicase [Rosa chinensis]
MCHEQLSTHLVVVMGTQYYDGRENLHTDYPIADLLQMIGHACRPKKDNSGKCVILCHAPRKEYYKKFLYEALPVESHLHHYLHDNLNAEVVAQVIGNHEGALNYLAWTFFYRRLTQNPNYYLQGVTHIILSTFQSFYSPIERFNSSLTSKTKMKGLLEILAHASGYSQLSIRPGEEEVIRRLINHHRFSFENPNFTDPHVKANALLQAHFARHHVAGDLSLDQLEVLLSASRLLHAIFDVLASNGWLNLSLIAMEVSQMVTRGMWDHDLMLLQLPHFTMELAKRCQKFPGKNIERVGPLHAPRYPRTKEEGWWLVVGDTKTNSLLAIKRVPLLKKAKVQFRFLAPAEAGNKTHCISCVIHRSGLGLDRSSRGLGGLHRWAPIITVLRMAAAVHWVAMVVVLRAKMDVVIKAKTNLLRVFRCTVVDCEENGVSSGHEACEGEEADS